MSIELDEMILEFIQNRNVQDWKAKKKIVKLDISNSKTHYKIYHDENLADLAQ